MPSLQVRDLDDRVYRALARRAERERRSLARQAAVILEAGLEPAGDRNRRQALLAKIRDNRGDWPGDLAAPAELLREDRDR
jgi:plasmid stability protein